MYMATIAPKLWRHIQNARVIRFVDCTIKDTKLRKEEEEKEKEKEKERESWP